MVNAADTQNGGQGVASAAAAASAPGGAFQDRAFAESLLRRGLGDGGMSGLHEELLRQKQAENMRQAAALHAHQQQQQSANPGAGLLQQFSESQQLSQQLQQQLSQSDIRSALANAQLRQAPQLSNADIMALARSGALPGLGGLLGGSGLAGLTGGSGAGFDQRLGELQELQNLEELERRQRLLASAAGLQQMGGAGLHQQQMSGAGQLMAQAQAAQAQAQAQAQSLRAPEVARSEPDAAPVPSAAAPLATGAGAPNGSAMLRMAANAPGPAATAGGDKKEQRRDPGSVVVPCRARGMPMDHNFKVRSSGVHLGRVVNVLFFWVFSYYVHHFFFHYLNLSDCIFCHPSKCSTRRGVDLLLFCLQECWSQISVLLAL